MKATGKAAPRKRVEPGKYIVADSGICHGKPTFKGSRVMVWQVLAELPRGERVDELCDAWPRAVTPEAVAEAVELAGAMFRDPRCAPYAARAAKMVQKTRPTPTGLPRHQNDRRWILPLQGSSHVAWTQGSSFLATRLAHPSTSLFPSATSQGQCWEFVPGVLRDASR